MPDTPRLARVSTGPEHLMSAHIPHILMMKRRAPTALIRLLTSFQTQIRCRQQMATMCMHRMCDHILVHSGQSSNTVFHSRALICPHPLIQSSRNLNNHIMRPELLGTFHPTEFCQHQSLLAALFRHNKILWTVFPILYQPREALGTGLLTLLPQHNIFLIKLTAMQVKNSQTRGDVQPTTFKI